MLTKFKKLSKREKFVYLFITIFLCSIIYIISYGVILPVFEKFLYIKKAAYLIYEPVEYIRVQSDAFWLLTEKAYTTCGGKTFPKDRYFFNSRRKMLLRYENGKIRIKTFYRSGLEDGQQTLYSKEGNVNGIGIFSKGTGSRVKFGNNLNVEYIHHLKDGRQSGKWCWYKNDWLVEEILFENGKEKYDANYFNFLVEGEIKYRKKETLNYISNTVETETWEKVSSKSRPMKFFRGQSLN